jgi:pimeloyl-ACP methyl ester carboxylesterase
MAALRRPRVDGVITRAAPTRLAGLHGSLLHDAHRFFDPPNGGFTRWSPALHRLTTPVLLAHGTHDPYVPFAQAKAMLHNSPHGRLVALRSGKAPWVHGTVSKVDLGRFLRLEHRFLERAAG